jgi:hypothetical protein
MNKLQLIKIALLTALLVEEVRNAIGNETIELITKKVNQANADNAEKHLF